MTELTLNDWVNNPKDYYIKIIENNEGQQQYAVKKRGFFTGLDLLMHSGDYKLKKVYEYFQTEKGRNAARTCIPRDTSTSFQSVMERKVQSHNTKSKEHNKWVEKLPSLMQKIVHKRDIIQTENYEEPLRDYQKRPEYGFYLKNNEVFIQPKHQRGEGGICILRGTRERKPYVALFQDMNNIREGIRFICSIIDFSKIDSSYSVEIDDKNITIKKDDVEIICIEDRKFIISGNNEGEKKDAIKKFVEHFAKEIVEKADEQAV